MNALESLKEMTKVVADTANFALIDQFKPHDATTNPSLVFQGFKMPEYDHLIVDAIEFARRQSSDSATQLEWALDKLTVNFGVEILKKVPGRVSTEVDAKYSFSIDSSVAKARRLIQLYAEQGFDKSRIYIKLAATWQGIQAARILEAEGISCNLTLLFSFAQAVACAQAGVSLISPFVGRILDWHKKANQRDYSPEEDPGVQSVRRIYNYYKAHGYATIVMGASFRNIGEILQLAGCDNLTISPALLTELSAQSTGIERRLSSDIAKSTCQDEKWCELSESAFLMEHNEDAMAVEKLAEGIRLFNRDTRALEKTLQERFSKC